MQTRTYYVHLASDTGPTITLDIATWGAVYNLALDHGWRPMGTEPPAGWQPTFDLEWSRAYVIPAGQRVGEVDARNLADALVQGLDDMRRGREKVVVRRVICVCRAGRFRIG